MRRREFEVKDPREIQAVLAQIGWGTLALATEGGFPIQVPLNFVQLDHCLYAHGAKTGEKMTALAGAPLATFLVVDPHALLPSTFFHGDHACPATHFFKSVLVKGRTRLVEDPAEKARALQALMEKLQPEGGYAPITAEDPRYQASLRGVAVIALSIDEVTAKFKLGQNLSPEVAEQVIAQLQARDGGQDARTIDAMQPYRTQ